MAAPSSAAQFPGAWLGVLVVLAALQGGAALENKAFPSAGPRFVRWSLQQGSPACTDTPPDSRFTCAQQAALGQCNAPWMLSGNYCQQSCGRCPGACSDIPPDQTYSCAQQAAFGACNKPFIRDKGFCLLSCGRCAVGGPPAMPYVVPVPSPERRAAAPAPAPSPERRAPVMRAAAPPMAPAAERRAPAMRAAVQPMAPAVERPAPVMRAVTPPRAPTPEAASPAPAAAAAPGACTDNPPDSRFTCTQQAAFGKCDAPFIVSGNYCQRSCGRCPVPSPAPVASPAPPTVAPAVLPVPAPAPERAAVLPAPPQAAAPGPCTDNPPDSRFTCTQQAAFGKCDTPFIVSGNFCQRSCGRCPVPSLPSPGVPFPPTYLAGPAGERPRAYAPPTYTAAPVAPGPGAPTHYGPAPQPYTPAPLPATPTPPGPANALPASAPRPEVAVASPAPAATAAPAPVAEGAPVAPLTVGPAPEGCTTAARLLQSDPNMSTFTTLAQAAGVLPQLASPNSLFIVFAPNTTAFQAAFQGLNLSEAQLLADPALLRAIVEYHVVPERALTTAQLISGDRLPTLAPGQLLEVEKPAGTTNTYLQGALGYPQGQIINADVPACDGLVNYINSVLISQQADQLLVARGNVAG